MSEYTKGPWFYRPDSSSNESGHPAGDFMVGDCSDRPDNVAVCTGVGDAALIAAAPDLLEALVALVGYTSEANKGVSILDRDDLWEAAASAIAKATAHQQANRRGG